MAYPLWRIAKVKHTFTIQPRNKDMKTHYLRKISMKALMAVLFTIAPDRKKYKFSLTGDWINKL